MMMKSIRAITTVLLALLAFGGARAEDGEGASTAYFQSSAFNAPILDGWADQSGDDNAQFHLEAAAATIRVRMLEASDVVAAAEAEVAAMTGLQATQPVYQNKVNLADGTWTALVYDLDAATTASLMAREAGERVVVISLVERDPGARAALLTVAQADEALDEAKPEIALALAALTESTIGELTEAESVSLPSGEWVVYAGEGMMAMGMIFGNDSYVALGTGEPGALASLAEAYSRTVLGFFITPDNSLYLALGLVVTFVILGLLAGSLYWRERSLRKDLALLEALAAE